ncbi:MAG: hypothetical protein JW820_02935 [Spirochaetales bacterium]|nr:hypothetical protein [Spirochaetales bacterium]
MKRIIIIALGVFLAAAAVAGACELHFSLVDSAGIERPVSAANGSSGDSIPLELGEEYTLQMVYREDHRNCTVEPEDTVLLLEGARWRPARDTQPLILAAPVTWTQPQSRTNQAEVRFVAAAAGSWTLEIIRECDRGGYHGELVFAVAP